MKKKYGAFALVALALALGLAACGQSNSSSSASSDSSTSSASSSEDKSSSEASSSSESSSSSEAVMVGDGTKASPYLPLTAEHLIALGKKVVSTNPTYIKLTADIDLGGKEWTPLGSKAAASSLAKVNFDGNGHTIKGLSITETNAEADGLYGLFGIVQGQIYDLSVEGNISLTANSATTYAGLLAGIAYNCEINDCHSKGNVEVVDNTESTDESSSAGGLVGSFQTLSSYFVSLSGCSAEGNVTSLASLGDAGGLVGTVTTSSSSLGIGSLNSNSVKSDAIIGSVDAGGILGSSYYYASIVNNIAEVNSVSVTSAFNNAAFAGGIIGSTYYENAFLYNIAKVTSIDGGKKASSSYVGDISGDVMDDGFSAGATVEGAAVYGNISLGSALTGSIENGIDATLISALKADELSAIGFSSDVWTLKDGALPVLTNGIAAGKTIKGNATIKANYEGGDDESLAFETGTINQAFQSAKTTRTDDHTFINTCYDAAGSVSYRWYAPLNFIPTVYNSWFDATLIAGFHLGEDSYNPVLDFKTDGTLTTIFSDYETDTSGVWWSNGRYIVFSNEFYSDCIATIAGTSISFADANADYYVYKYSKAPIDYGYYKDDQGHMLSLQGNGLAIYTDGTSKMSITYTVKDGVITLALSAIGYEDTPIVNNADGSISITFADPDYPFTLTLKKSDGVPDYSANGVSGQYFGSINFKLELGTDGNFKAYRPDSDNVYGTGGFRVFGNAVEIRSNALTGVPGDYAYNAKKGVLLKKDGSVIFVKGDTYVSTFATEDGSVRVYAFMNNNYLVINGNLDTTLAITGSFKDGETVTIGDDEYTISGTVLKKVEKTPDVTPLVNTYVGTVDSSEVVLVLNADKTGSYGGRIIHYAFDGTTVSFTAGSLVVSLTWDATAKTLTGFVDSPDNNDHWAVTFSVKPSDPVVKSMVGSFSGKGIGGTSWGVTVNKDNTLSINVGTTAYSGTWTGSVTSSIVSTDLTDASGSTFYSDEGLTFTYSSTSDTLLVSFAQDYEDYSFTLARA